MDRATEQRLLNDFQRGFPLVSEPYAELAARVGVDEADVRALLAQRIADGTVSRVGAVFAPGAIGVSTLAAMSVPLREIEAAAAIVSARPEVNHNYEREHAQNLWFVATAPDAARLDAALSGIARETGCEVLRLPMLGDYAIDLGFDLARSTAERAAPMAARRDRPTLSLSSGDARLVAALEDGLAPVRRPFLALARAAGLDEDAAIGRIAGWVQSGAIARFGVVVRHRRLGFAANAMCVWDVPDAMVDDVGHALARESGVTLCYRRARALPQWRFNLYCMIHGRERGAVLARIAQIAGAHALGRFDSAVLFSLRAFKQCGARYASLGVAA